MLSSVVFLVVLVEGFRLTIADHQYQSSEHFQIPQIGPHHRPTTIDTDPNNEVGLSLHFPCREATRAIVHWESSKSQIFGIDVWNRFVVTVYIVDEETKLLNSYQDIKSEPSVQYVKALDIKANTTYRFGVHLRIPTDNRTVEIITEDVYSTREEDYRNLSTVLHSEVSPLISIGGKEVRTNFTWLPIPENVCTYEILIINQNATFGEHPQHFFTSAEDFYQLEIPNLCYGCRISIAVYGNNAVTEGKKRWLTFDSPTCVEFHKWDYNLCAPLEPENVTIDIQDCLLELSWNRQKYYPPYYQIQITPSNPKRYLSAVNESITGEFNGYRGYTHNLGEYMTVKLTAFSHAGYGPSWVMGVENNCTPEAAAAEPVGPPVRYNNIDYNRYTTTTEKPSAQTHLPLSYLLPIVFFIICMIGLIVVIGLRAYYTIHKTEHDPLVGRSDLEMREPLASKDMLALQKAEDDEAAEAQLPSTAEDEDAGEFEVRRETIQLKEIVGEGEFGVVRRAFIQQRQGDHEEKREVAVKMLRDDASAGDKRQLRLELEVMKSVGTHKNIVCLVGFCSSSHMLVVEYCSLGDLQNYLRDIWRKKNWARAVYLKNKPIQSGENVVSNLLYNKTEIEKKQLNVTIFDLISLSRQVALGMEYLSKNKVVHRDLAARNILLNSAFTAKISDFGLSRDVYEENMYRHKGVHRLPIKWMAIECLAHQMFTTMSDVWSFGILLWEIMTLGGCPYPSLQTAEIFKYLQQGERLEKPKLCPKQLYDIMHDCWDEIPHKRPTFTQIVQRLEAIMQTDQQHRYLQLDDVIDSYSHLYVSTQLEADAPTSPTNATDVQATDDNEVSQQS
ncbi:tyrosine-protein kinase receptor torso [Nesidiocoris tenuis]|uniref:Tyrosine-protein kinase receptor torso n=1 Tax=Nesidiocoris tenuis TaxID=355587 RepID=A0ABN7B880_9HEMI|nr:tyrosine-protein kinase receptor torso [Nesidiocoris tenuis]